MTNMTPVSSAIGASKTTTTSVLQVSFEEALIDKLSLEFEKSTIDQLKPLVAKLPTIETLNETENAEKYASALTQLIQKQEAISGTFSVDVVNDWVKAIPATNGLAEANDVINKVNTTLANHFQTWFESKLEDSVSPGLPTGFISNFRLGAESTQAQQIAGLTADKLNEKNQEIKGFLQDLGASFRPQRADENASKFLSRAFESFGNGASVSIEEMKKADFLLTKDRFQSSLETALNESLKGIGTFEASDIKSLAEKITWIPGIKPKQLKEVLVELVKEVEQQFGFFYESDEVKSTLKIAFNDAIKHLNDKASINITSLFSSVVATSAKAQIQNLYSELHEAQKEFLSQSSLKKIQTEVEKDISKLLEREVEVLFANALSQGTSDKKALEFAEHLNDMRKNLGMIEARLKTITEDEKTPNKEGQYQVKPEHLLGEKDLLSVIKANISGHFDERILLAFEQHRWNRFEKREKQKEGLESLTATLKIFSEVQAQLQKMQSAADPENDELKFGAGYKPSAFIFEHQNFKFADNETFYKSPEFKKLYEVYRAANNLSPIAYKKPQQGIPSDYFNTEAVKKHNDNVKFTIDNFVRDEENIKKFIKPEFHQSIRDDNTFKVENEHLISGEINEDSFVLTAENVKNFIKAEYQHPEGRVRGFNEPKGALSEKYLDTKAVKEHNDKVTIILRNFDPSSDEHMKLIKPELQNEIRAGSKKVTNEHLISGEINKDSFVLTAENIKNFIKAEYQHPDGGIKPDNSEVKVTHLQFIVHEAVKAEDKEYKDGEDVKRLANLASQISDRTKMLNLDVQKQTNDLNETNGQYNATIEAMSKFVQKYINIIETILRNF
ncbi:virulence-associated V antigen [Vibrio caribbeanicus]|uniref:virulence-associated V antigen n=1 Tax=Vibrio caribbeanicus TaxID=701175 RepID=UPI0030D89609